MAKKSEDYDIMELCDLEDMPEIDDDDLDLEDEEESFDEGLDAYEIEQEQFSEDDQSADESYETGKKLLFGVIIGIAVLWILYFVGYIDFGKIKEFFSTRPSYQTPQSNTPKDNAPPNSQDYWNNQTNNNNVKENNTQSWWYTQEALPSDGDYQQQNQSDSWWATQNPTPCNGNTQNGQPESWWLTQ